MARRESVVIAGGGVGGLAAAAALAGRGVDVTVVERDGRIGTHGTGLVLHPNGVRAADVLSSRLGARLRALGHVTRPGEVRLLMDPAGAVLGEEPVGAMGGEPDAPQIPLPHSSLQRVLLDESLTAGAAVLLATTVADYTARDDGVTVELSDGKTLDCAALVAADGIDSAVRRRMLGDGPAEYRGYTSVRGRTSGSALGQCSRVVNGRGIRLSVVPVGGDTLCWTAEITAPPGVWPAKGPARARADLVAALTGWHPPVVDLVRKADPYDITVTDIRDRAPAPRWVDGRVALLGDAAHPMVPALGQGANMALEDALVLADAIASHREVPAALMAYQRERLERTSAVVFASRCRGALDREPGRGGGAHREDPTAAGRDAADAVEVLDWKPRTRRQTRHVVPAARETPEPAREGSGAVRKPHVVLVGGSLRQGSTCDRVADWCARRCTEQGATARVFTGAEIDFPAYRPGLAGSHPGVRGFLDELRRSDGVVLVSPTYHGTVSGLLKNALDYVNDIDGPAPYLDGRAIGCVAVGVVAQGAASTLATLRTIGHAVRGWPTPAGVAVSGVPSDPSAGGSMSGEEERLVRMVSQILWMGRARLAAGQSSVLGAVA